MLFKKIFEFDEKISEELCPLVFFDRIMIVKQFSIY